MIITLFSQIIVANEPQAIPPSIIIKLGQKNRFNIIPCQYTYLQIFLALVTEKARKVLKET